MTAAADVSPLAHRVSIGILAFVAVLVVVGAAIGWNRIGVHKAKMEPAYLAAKAIGGSTSVGVNYAKFQELLQQFQTQLSIVADKRPTSAERAILDHYATSTAIYVDSLALWKLQITEGSYLSDYGPASVLKAKYSLPVSSAGAIDAEAGVQAIWAKAAQEVALGNDLYNR